MINEKGDIPFQTLYHLFVKDQSTIAKKQSNNY